MHLFCNNLRGRISDPNFVTCLIDSDAEIAGPVQTKHSEGLRSGDNYSVGSV